MKDKLSFRQWAELNGYDTTGERFTARAKQYEMYLGVTPPERLKNGEV